MSDLPVAGDIEQALIDWAPTALAARGFAGFTVAADLAGTDSIAVYRTGGPELLGGILDNPTVVVEVKCARKARGHDVLQMLRSLIRDLVGGQVGGLWVQEYGEFAGPAWLPSEDAPHRYTMTLSLVIAARVV